MSVRNRKTADRLVGCQATAVNQTASNTKASKLSGKPLVPGRSTAVSQAASQKPKNSQLSAKDASKPTILPSQQLDILCALNNKNLGQVNA